MWTTVLKDRVCGIVLGILIVIVSVIPLSGQTTVFTVQGVMTDSGTPANGTFDFQFRLFDALTEGSQIGNTLTVPNMQTDGGAWRANLDFGAVPFPGADRFLEISYSRAGEGSFTTITPRRLITGIPYSTRSLNASVAVDAQNLGGTPASQFVQTNDPRMSDPRSPLPGSDDYVQNTSVTQASANFNVGGTGSADILNANTQFNLTGARILSGNVAAKNLFIGINIASGGTGNTIAGTLAAVANTTGFNNAIFGSEAGRDNTTGNGNAFFGDIAGRANTTGAGNAFFGRAAGFSNTIGGSNSFYGPQAGFRNTSGIQNSFVGVAAGSDNTTGSRNIAIGDHAGQGNIIGSDNIFIGRSARTSSSTTTINNSVAIGTTATVAKSNTIVLGTTSHETQIPGRFVTGIPFSTGGPLPGRGYVETFFQTNVFQGIYTPNVLIGSYASNPRGTLRPCVVFQTIPGLATGVTLTNCVSSFSSFNDKTDVMPFTDGIELVKLLRPVAFKHKENGANGIGLNAEDVARVAPSIVTKDEAGAVENVSESGLIVLLLNAVKQQDERIRRQQAQVDELRKMVCTISPHAEACKDK